MDYEVPDDELSQAIAWHEEFRAQIFFIDPEHGWVMGATKQPVGRDLEYKDSKVNFRNRDSIQTVIIQGNCL